MLTKALVLTDGEADLLSRVLEEVKTKTFEESETSLDDTQALHALLSSRRIAETEEPEKEQHHTYFSPLSKRLVLGTLLDRRGSADSPKSSSRKG
jgi:hypothetical protein